MRNIKKTSYSINYNDIFGYKYCRYTFLLSIIFSFAFIHG